MKTNDFYRLLSNPSLLNAQTLIDLEQLAISYPYAENVKTLFVLNLLKLNDIRYQKTLTEAALYASSRRKLKFWVDEINQLQKKDQIEIDLHPIDTSNTDDKKKEEETKTPPRQEDIKQKGILNQKKDRTKRTSVKTKAELLQLVKKRLLEIEAKKKENDKKKENTESGKSDLSKTDLIEQFIKSQPSISRPNKNDFFNPQNEAIESTTDDNDYLVTETLARIHADQGNNLKAIEIYRKLILKFPEKSSYFAARIENLNK